MKTYSKMLKLRSELNIPVEFMLNVVLEDKETGFFYKTLMTNYGGGGISIEWKLCEFCPGYTEGAIHPDCLFSLYDAERKDSRELTIYIHLPDSDDTIKFKGKAIYTFKFQEKEQIGFEFSENKEEIFNQLQSAFEQ
jgi:hypothetical protein